MLTAKETRLLSRIVSAIHVFEVMKSKMAIYLAGEAATAVKDMPSVPTLADFRS